MFVFSCILHFHEYAHSWKNYTESLSLIFVLARLYTFSASASTCLYKPSAKVFDLTVLFFCCFFFSSPNSHFYCIYLIDVDVFVDTQFCSFCFFFVTLKNAVKVLSYLTNAHSSCKICAITSRIRLFFSSFTS